MFLSFSDFLCNFGCPACRSRGVSLDQSSGQSHQARCFPPYAVPCFLYLDSIAALSGTSESYDISLPFILPSNRSQSPVDSPIFLNSLSVALILVQILITHELGLNKAWLPGCSLHIGKYFPSSRAIFATPRKVQDVSCLSAFALPVLSASFLGGVTLPGLCSGAPPSCSRGTLSRTGYPL